MPSLNHSMQPLMKGGVKRAYRGTEDSKLMRRDDFIALEAEGEDFDMAQPGCEKLFQCPDNGCVKSIPIHGRVKFQWIITGNPNTRGSFVHVGCIPDTLVAEGEHVIFKPPYVPLPVMNKDTTVSTTILLLVIDAGSPVADPTVKKTVTINITRSKSTPDFYSVEVTGIDYKPMKATPSPSKDGCSCNPVGPNWKKSDDLKKPDIILPAASKDNNKLVAGQWMILTTSNQTDKDLATYTCNSKSDCKTGTIPQEYEDIVLWQWTVKGGGAIILSDTGQYVIYEAPKEIPQGQDFIDVKIELKVYNPKGREDPEKNIVAEKVIRIYRPGIKLHYPDITWLPEEKNNVELKSELVYSSAGKWLPAFDHMCRVQYFELIYVSNEKGICMNYPPPDKADVCLDLQLKPADNLEVFAAPDPVKGKCSLNDQFMQARTGKPVKEFTIKAYSLDYGAWGFMRSFANINYGIVKGESGLVEKGIDKKGIFYQPVVWTTQEALHPLRGNNRVKAKEYKDNRVSIPYDVDENRVADNGWKTPEGIKRGDPPFVFNEQPTAEALKDAKRKGTDIVPDNDREETPVGDGFRGDGLGSFEEYRGFKVMVDKKESHIRTDYELKDIFVCNEDGFDLSLYKSVSGLGVHEINKTQFNSTAKRQINFNNNARTHVVDQCGLYLFNAGKHDKLLGIAVTNTGSPSTPNFTTEVRIYKQKVDAEIAKFKLDGPGKMRSVVAHELLHGNNVCHHGEGKEDVEKSHDLINGLRSGNIECVMHYDNSGNNRDINYIPEPVGSRLCSSRAGTGYNTNENKLRREADGGDKSEKYMWFGPALEGRGNCAAQIRVSGRGSQPSTCGNRYDEKKELKKEFKEKEP